MGSKLSVFKLSTITANSKLSTPTASTTLSILTTSSSYSTSTTAIKFPVTTKQRKCSSSSASTKYTEWTSLRTKSESAEEKESESIWKVINHLVLGNKVLFMDTFK